MRWHLILGKCARLLRQRKGGSTFPDMSWKGPLFRSFLIDCSTPSAFFLVHGNPPCLGHVGGTSSCGVMWWDRAFKLKMADRMML